MRRMVLIVALLASIPRTASADCDAEACNGFACVDGGCGTGCNVDGDCSSGHKCDTAHNKCVVPDPDAGQPNTNQYCGYGRSTNAPFLIALAMLGLLRRR